MKGSAAEIFLYNAEKAERDLEQYYSVEIPVCRLNIIYQFKIREIEYKTLSILIKEDSDLLNWVKPGDRLKMRFYSHVPLNPYQDLLSELIHIERQVNGRLQGHYLARIEIMEEQHDLMQSWPYRPTDWNIIPFQMWSKDF